MADTLLKVDGINVYYGNIHAVKDISFTVNAGEIVTLIGANGAGKSTTLKTISGLLKPRTGDVLYKGKSIKGVRAHKIVESGLAQVPEGRHVFLHMTVDENLDMGAYTQPASTIAANKEKVFTLFPRLKERRKQLAGTMSGGEQQMLAMGRALMCSVCALAAILTIAITMTLLKRGKTPASPGEQPSSEVLVPGEEDISDHYQISETSAALLPETADAGESYQKETLFLGDSNTVRLYANGLISLQQFCAKEGIGTHAALNEGIVTFKKDSNTYTIAQAVAKMKPRRVVIMLGTNDTGMSVDEFIKNYTALVQAIQESYPYTDIIVNTVPPVPANHANYPHMDQTKIDDFNMALLSMCEQMGLKFLNSAEALKDANGYGREDYYQTGDIHLKPVGLKAMLSYLRTHAYQTDDRRPDTANIPTRAEYTPNPSSAVTAPSSSEAAGSSEEQGVLYQASYRVDKTGGTLSSGSDSGKTSPSYEVTNAAQSISVTAVPQDGYVFVKWSDGVTQKTRTDTNFKQNAQHDRLQQYHGQKWS